MNYSIFTCGDINGIGPEICIKSFNRLAKEKNKIVFICPGNIFYKAIATVNPMADFRVITSPALISPDNSVIDVIDIGNAQLKIGKPTRQSGEIAFKAINIGLEIAMMFDNASLITAPICKEALKMAGVKFTGHTEILANLCMTDEYAMMFLSDEMKCALATIHVPVKDLSKHIKQDKIKSLVNIVSRSLKNDFLIQNPKIALLGLNPHAGENGNIGTEEIKEILPAIKKLKNKNISGPFVPDAFYALSAYKEFDCTIGMYHDQVLIPFKMLNFNTGVNFTAGLPVVRTSPDHGTAYGIAWKNIADETSMLNAFRWANIIVKNRAKKK